MKKLLLILVLLIVAAVVGVGLFAGTLIETGVEKGGTWALQTPTTLDGASLSVLGGSIGLDGLTVKTPPGFQVDPALAVGGIAVDVDLGSLTSDVIHVNTIEIDAPEVTIEATAGGTNLGALMDNLEKRRQELGSGAKEPTTEEEKAAGKKLVVGLVTIKKARVTVAQAVVGNVTLKLPDIELKDIGTAQNPTDLVSLIQKIVGAIMAAVADTKAIPDLSNLLNQEIAIEALDDVKKQVDKVAGELEKAAEQLPGGLGDAAKDASKKADDLLEGVGGLLGGDKKDEKKKKDG